MAVTRRPLNETEAIVFLRGVFVGVVAACLLFAVVIVVALAVIR